MRYIVYANNSNIYRENRHPSKIHLRAPSEYTEKLFKKLIKLLEFVLFPYNLK